MRSWLEIQRVDRVESRAIRVDGNVGIADGSCPGCGVEPFRVLGCNLHRIDNQVIRSGGRCSKCGDAVGYVYAELNT